MKSLDIKDCSIVGFSMGGGEVVRYLTDFGSEKITKAVLISSIIPLVPKKSDNPNGVPEKDLNEIMQALKSDRVGFLKQFHHNFYKADKLSDKVSDAQLEYDWVIASHASPSATIKCAEGWATTDFRQEMKNVTVPTLIIHGDADNIVPIETSGNQAAEMISNNQYEVIKGAPHGLNVTHREKMNKLLLKFLKS